MTKFWLENNEVKGDMDLSIFNDAQMEEIRLGLDENLDVSPYSNQSIPIFKWKRSA